jgi:SEC-C motif domain protein
MRSRYCAYALHKSQYILDTTDPEGPHFRADAAAWRRDVLTFSRQTEFDGLEVLEHEEDCDRAHVLFVASLRQDGVPAPLRERSAFQRRDGRWYYVCAEPE